VDEEEEEVMGLGMVVRETMEERRKRVVSV